MDQLTESMRKELIYDEIGNLEIYDNHRYEWVKASQLESITGPVINASYTYDYTGLRKSKTTGTTTTEFIWAGGLLMAQIGGGNTIAWHYDQSGKMMGFTLNNVPYFYLRNLQGDAVAILDTNGIIVAEYAYDAWGKVLSATGPLAGINPIRYRGYYYDNETGFYYCQSRYYNPVWCRWISADVFMDTADGILGTNMYAYCQNDPVDSFDPNGYSTLNPALPMPTTDALDWLLQNGYYLSIAAGPLIAAAFKPIAIAVGAVAAVGAVGVAAYGMAIQDQAAYAMELQIEVAKAQGRLEERFPLFYPAILGIDIGYEGGIVVDKRYPMDYVQAMHYVVAGGDVWTEKKQDARNLGTLVNSGIRPVTGNFDRKVLERINAKHFHPLTGSDRVHIFYGTTQGIIGYWTGGRRRGGGR